MGTDKISISKFIIKFGIIHGVLWILYGILRYVNHIVPNGPWYYSALEHLIFSCLILYIYKYKRKNGGNLKLLEALKVGTGVAFIGSIFAIIWAIILWEILDPEYLYEYKDSIRKSIIFKNPDMTPEEVSTKMTKLFRFDNTYFKISALLIYNTLVGFIISLITGAIMYKRKKM